MHKPSTLTLHIVISIVVCPETIFNGVCHGNHEKEVCTVDVAIAYIKFHLLNDSEATSRQNVPVGLRDRLSRDGQRTLRIKATIYGPPVVQH